MPPSPWIDLGWIQDFTRKSESKTAPVMSGIPAAALEQVRETLQAQVSLQFLSWTKLTMALATGAQHMNLLVAAAGEEQGLAVLHYDADFDLIAAVTGQPCQWVVPAGASD